MKTPITDMIEIVSVDRPDHRAEAIAVSIMQSAFQAAYGEAWTAAQLTGFMSLPGVRLSLARIDMAWLGFALSRQVADEAELLLLAAARNWHNRGVGGRLLRDVIGFARKSGVKTLHLEVRENNPAIDFYYHFGFECVHRRPAYYRGHDGTCYEALSFRLIVR